MGPTRQVPPWSGTMEKNPSASYSIWNSWSQGEPGHLKSTEIFPWVSVAWVVSWL